MSASNPPSADAVAPKLVGLDADETPVDVSSWWADAPVVAIFLRHFG